MNSDSSTSGLRGRHGASAERFGALRLQRISLKVPPTARRPGDGPEWARSRRPQRTNSAAWKEGFCAWQDEGRS
jgi:hypothetical protein